jgi:hypothetical protein
MRGRSPRRPFQRRQSTTLRGAVSRSGVCNAEPGAGTGQLESGCRRRLDGAKPARRGLHLLSPLFGSDTAPAPVTSLRLLVIPRSTQQSFRCASGVTRERWGGQTGSPVHHPFRLRVRKPRPWLGLGMGISAVLVTAGACAVIALTGRNPSRFSAWRSDSAVNTSGQVHCAAAERSTSGSMTVRPRRWRFVGRLAPGAKEAAAPKLTPHDSDQRQDDQRGPSL